MRHPTHTPGATLTELVQRGAPVRTLEAAGAELYRVHGAFVAGRVFSHGDLHLSNVLFSAQDERARLIDFETVHTGDQDAASRHADDLACLALDLAATSPRLSVDWAAFLRGYALRDAVRAKLAAKLVVLDELGPRSLQLLRTHHLPRPQLAERFGVMRQELGT